MQLQNNTIYYQNSLAEYCRSGVETSIPGINKDNVKQYRRLVYNVVFSNVKETFPILDEVMDEKMLDEMVNDFFKNHNCQTPQIWKLSREFVEYAMHANWKEKYDLPWLNDLLLVEHTENEVFTMPDKSVPEHRPLINFLDENLVINPEYVVLELNYPVHLFPIDQVEAQKGQYAVLVYRHPETCFVRFFNISPLFRILIDEIKTTGKPVREILPAFLKHFGLKQNIETERSITAFIGNLYNEQFILGGKA